MLNFSWLKWRVCRAECDELLRWRFRAVDYERYLSEFPDVVLAIRNLRAEASGEQLDLCTPAIGPGPWDVGGLREYLRKRRSPE